jgi:hypothetical protein
MGVVSGELGASSDIAIDVVGMRWIGTEGRWRAMNGYLMGCELFVDADLQVSWFCWAPHYSLVTRPFAGGRHA